jgi:hypothetical protein
LRALATVEISDVRSFNSHNEQVDLDAGSLDIIAYTRNAAYNTSKTISVRLQ